MDTRIPRTINSANENECSNDATSKVSNRYKKCGTIQLITVRVFFVLVLLALILVPFFLFEASINQWFEGFRARPHSVFWLALILTAVLASDIVLPVPSSIVSAAGGALLGFWGGFLVSFIGMTLGCIIGYMLGFIFGRKALLALSGAEEISRIERAAQRFGLASIVLFRAVPVLAEASSVLAGVGKIRLSIYVATAALSNAGLSMIYAYVGNYAATQSTFLLAFTAALLLPGVAWLGMKVIRI